MENGPVTVVLPIKSGDVWWFSIVLYSHVSLPYRVSMVIFHSSLQNPCPEHIAPLRMARHGLWDPQQAILQGLSWRDGEADSNQRVRSVAMNKHHEKNLLKSSCNHDEIQNKMEKSGKTDEHAWNDGEHVIYISSVKYLSIVFFAGCCEAKFAENKHLKVSCQVLDT